MIRPIRLTDLWALRSQTIEALDMPEMHVRGFSALRFGARSATLPVRTQSELLLSTRRLHPIASCYSFLPRDGEESRLVALGSWGGDPEAILEAWGGLLQRTCLRAAGDGRLRVVARPEVGGEPAQLLQRLGFTTVTREHVLASPVHPARLQRQPGFAPLQRRDAWDAWKLYNRTEPATVARAEGSTPASWWRRRRAQGGPLEEWILRADGDVVVHGELLCGRESASLNLHYDPDHRDRLGSALEHALAICANRKLGTLLCTVRDHQAEMESLLLERGFASLRAQFRLALYTSVLGYAREQRTVPAAVEKAVPIGRRGVSGLSRSDEEGWV